jgi:starch-binding outer membrane protein, SusD/RagB family
MMHSFVCLRRKLRRTLELSMAAVALSALTACSKDDLLSVQDPDVATPQSLDDLATLPTQRASVISDFQVAMGAGLENGVISNGALLADEFIWAETFPTRFEMDVRSTNPINVTLDGVYQAVHRARVSAERVEQNYARLLPNSIGRAEVQALAAYSYVLLAETYCNGIPLSTFNANAGTSDLGEPLTNAVIYQRAVAKFDSALAVVGTPAANNAEAIRVQQLARVGKGRALLNLGRFADAAAAVALVPTGFRYQLVHSENTARQNNGVFIPTHVAARFSVANREGTNGLPFREDGATDPRVFSPRGDGVGGFAAVGLDNITPMFMQTKYLSRSAAVVLADGVEARLIEAEALQRAGGNYLAVLNELRANLPTLLLNTALPTRFNPPAIAALPALVRPTTTAGEVDQLFKERAYWLFLTGHRLGDLRRLVRQYGRDAESVFPTGTFHKGGTYGVDVNYPISFLETNNPKFTGCLDRNP